MPNVRLRPFSSPSMWRKMSLANWFAPGDPQVYGRVEVDMSNALEYAHAESARTGTKVTPTHMVVRAIALALRKYPAGNVIIRWNRVYEREDVDVFCQINIAGEKPDLSGAVIRKADTKTPAEIASELAELAQAVREDRDQELGKARHSLDLMPAFLYRVVLDSLGFLQYSFNINPHLLGLPRDPFGGVMVTSVGGLGITEGYPPLVPMSRVPLLVSVGKVEERPMVVDGKVVARPVCIITSVFDHRIMDGFVASKLSSFLQQYLHDPAKGEAAA